MLHMKISPRHYPFIILPLAVAALAIVLLFISDKDAAPEARAKSVFQNARQDSRPVPVPQDKLPDAIKELEKLSGSPQELAEKLESAYILANSEQRSQLLDLCKRRFDNSLLPFLKKYQISETDSGLRKKIFAIVLSSSAATTDEILISNLAHYDTELALASLKEIRNRELKQAAPGLVKYLNRPDVKERWIAVDLLADICTGEAITEIGECAVSKRMDKQTRLRAITALGKIKAKGSKTILKQNLADKDEQIRLVSKEVLKVLN
ncbi:MAG: HEAT repeat domain-containing protein [Planctomycetota bacterium]